MRDHPDTHIDRGSDHTRSRGSYNPMPWEIPTSIDNLDASVRKPIAPGRSAESRAGSGSDHTCGSQSDEPITQAGNRTNQPSGTGPSSQRSSTISRLNSLAGHASIAIGSAILLGAFIGPRAVMRQAEEAAFTCWRALGDQLADYELGAISGQLDRERQDTEFVRGLRDGLWARLQSLERQRECVVVELKARGPRLACDSDCELIRLDAAIDLVKAAIARADGALEGARADLRDREVELITLQAEADLNRANLALARPVGDPVQWSSRITRARDLLGSPLEDRALRRPALESPATGE
jgi:hypothetical protein